MKKILIIFGVILGLIIVALAVTPMFINVDQYRPRIIQAANDRINGKLELGQLSLSLWGTIKVGIAGLSLQDVQGRKVISVQDAHVHLPWSSVFSGAPLLTIKMDKPEMRVIKDSSGKLNITSLMKDTPVQSPGQSPGAAGTSAGTTTLPAVVTRARIGVDLHEADLFYRDELTKGETHTSKLNVRMKDVSLSRETEIEIEGQLESTEDKLFKINGPFKVTARAKPEVSGGKLSRASLNFDANLDGLDIQATTAFHKKSGVSTRIEGALSTQSGSARIDKLLVKFFNAEITLAGAMNQLPDGKNNVDLDIKSNDIDIKPWKELIPMLSEYDLSGKMKLAANAHGVTDNLNYAADFAVEELKAKGAMLKVEPVTNIQLKIVTDKIEKLSINMKAPGNDLNVEGSMTSFTAPRLELRLASNSLDLDQLINLPDPKKAESKKMHAEGSGGSSGTAATPAGAEDLDKLLDPLRKNSIMAAMTAVVTANLKLVKVYDVRISDVAAKLSMKNLTVSVDSSSLHVFDGGIALKATAALRPEYPAYNFSATVAGLDLEKAVSSQLAYFKDTIIGRANVKMEGSGSSFNSERAKRNLNAKGSMRIDNATFTSIDIGKMALEAINKAVDKIGEKIPAVKGKGLKPLPARDAKYESVSSDFTLSGGKFNAPNFYAKTEKGKGLDVKGATLVGLIDQELKADWLIIDTYNVTGAQDISVDEAGTSVPHILAEGANPVMIPVSVGCKYTAPCVSYTQVPEHFLKVALGNVKDAATGRMKSEAKKKVQEQLGNATKNAPPAVQKALQGLSGKLFH